MKMKSQIFVRRAEMKRLILTVLPLIAFLSVTTVAFSGGLKMQPGLWQIKTTTSMKGMPVAMPSRTMSMQECVTSDQINDPWKNMQKNKNCKYTDLKVKAQSATWKIECTGEQPMHGEGAIYLDISTSYHGYSNMAVQNPQMPITTHIEYIGHRIGDCSK
jgi:hypothetical protein